MQCLILNQHIVAYPIKHYDSKLINIAGVCTWPDQEYAVPEEDMVVRPCDKKEVQEHFDGWEMEVRETLEVGGPHFGLTKSASN